MKEIVGKVNIGVFVMDKRKVASELVKIAKELTGTRKDKNGKLFLKKLKDSDYRFSVSHPTIQDIVQVVYMLSTNNRRGSIKPMKLVGSNRIYFSTEHWEIDPNYYAEITKDGFDLYELTLKGYNKMEEWNRELLETGKIAKTLLSVGAPKTGSKEWEEIMNMFEKTFKGGRKDKEDRKMWPGYVYQNGEVNEKFHAYLAGYVFGKTN